MSEKMEVDVLVLCSSDPQQINDDNILATIEGELLVDEAMSELAERPAFDESHTDNISDLPITSRDDKEMLTPDERRPGGVAFASDNTGPLQDEPAGSSDVCVLSATLPYTMRSDVVESREEETVSGDAADERRNSSDCAAEVCSDNSVSDIDCGVDNVLDGNCDPDNVSKSVCSVTENCSHNTEAVSNVRLLPDGRSEMSSVSCAETTSAFSVIDTYAVVNQSDMASDVDALLVSIPVTEPGDVTALYSTDEALVDNTEQSSGLSDEAERLKLAEAVDIEAKKKGFRVRFHEDHVVTGYHDPPTPWREGWKCS